jgi:regulatory protein
MPLAFFVYMGTITAIKNTKGQGKRVNIYIDGKFLLALDVDIAVREKLKVNMELEPGRVPLLEKSQQLKRGMDAAVRYLGYRPRSESEIRERLSQRGFDAETVEAVAGKLKEQGLIDDSSFARFWMENRETFSPRSRYLTARELKKKGVADEVIDDAVNGIDDSESAYRTASTRAGRMTVADYNEFRERLGGYLRRRGFNWETIKKVIEKIWQERQEA